MLPTDWGAGSLAEQNGLNRTTRLKINRISKREYQSAVRTVLSNMEHIVGNMQNGCRIFRENLTTGDRTVLNEALILNECVPVCSYALSLWVQRTDGCRPLFPCVAGDKRDFSLPKPAG